VGAAAVLKQSLKAWTAAFIGNLVAIIDVAIGMVALAIVAGSADASNGLYHGIMLTLATASLMILLVPAGRTELTRNCSVFTEDSGGFNPRFRTYHGQTVPYRLSSGPNRSGAAY
jgi:predicted anti-sigma-YlaC factor YlaD